MSRKPFLKKLHLQNFKSFRNETIEFDNPLFLVGKNGSGKSNLVRVFNLLADCMIKPLQDALSSQGNVWNSYALSTSDSPPLAVRADFRDIDAEGRCGFYALSLEVTPLHELSVTREQCSVSRSDGADTAWFDRTSRGFHTNVPGINPSVTPDALALAVIGGVEQFAPVVKAFRAMRVYAINPDSVRDFQEPTSDVYLKPDGSNVAGILERLARQHPDALKRLVELIGPAVPGIVDIRPVRTGGNGGSRLALLFTQQGDGDVYSLFDAASMSDGMLLILALLTAAMQDPAPSLIAIEEPESYIHPGALSTVAGLIQRASERSQVVITTHSPELLDTKWLKAKNIRVVEWENGATYVSPLGSAPVKALQEHIAGAGELLRSNFFDAAPHNPQAADANMFDELAS